MKQDVDFNYASKLIRRLDELVDQVKRISGNPVGTPLYQEMLEVVNELTRTLYGEPEKP
jgi:hypothetical protein